MIFERANPQKNVISLYLPILFFSCETLGRNFFPWIRSRDAPHLLRIWCKYYPIQSVLFFGGVFSLILALIFNSPKTVRFCGMEVERDFIEAPSQMLENWCWNVKSLRLLSRHYKWVASILSKIFAKCTLYHNMAHMDNLYIYIYTFPLFVGILYIKRTGEPIPDSLLQPLLQSRIANAGLLNKRQILFGLFDQVNYLNGINGQSNSQCYFFFSFLFFFQSEIV